MGQRYDPASGTAPLRNADQEREQSEKHFSV